MDQAHSRIRRPRREKRCPRGSRHHRFAVEQAGPAGDRHPHAVDFQPMEPFDRGPDHGVVAPADQPVSGGPVEEIMFTGPFPDKVPTVLRIDADRAAAAATPHMKRAGRSPFRPSLPVLDRVCVVTGGWGHESNPVHAAIFRIAETFHLPAAAPGGRGECAAKGCTGEGVVCVGRGNPGGHFHKIVCFQIAFGLRERYRERG